MAERVVRVVDGEQGRRCLATGLERQRPPGRPAERVDGGRQPDDGPPDREPIRTADDVENGFDAITYGKGEAVLAMFERGLGEDTFQRGVRSYLRDHAYGNADATDFLASLSEAAGRDVGPAFSGFLD